jgi:hypothetical protein
MVKRLPKFKNSISGVSTLGLVPGYHDTSEIRQVRLFKKPYTNIWNPTVKVCACLRFTIITWTFSGVLAVKSLGGGSQQRNYLLATATGLDVNTGVMSEHHMTIYLVLAILNN